MKKALYQETMEAFERLFGISPEWVGKKNVLMDVSNDSGGSGKEEKGFPANIPRIGRYIDPLTDWGFRHLFGQSALHC